MPESSPPSLDVETAIANRYRRAAFERETFRLFSKEPYRAHVELIEPYAMTPLDRAPPFARDRAVERSPRETKGSDYSDTRAGERRDGSGCC